MAAFITTLPKNLQIGFSFIVSGVRQNLSANRIISSLRKAELGARRQTILDVIRAVKEDIKSFDDVSRIRPRILPTLARIPEARTEIRRKFSYQFEIDQIQDGKATKRVVTLSTDNFLDFEAAKEAMVDTLDNNDLNYGYDSEVTAISLIDVRRRPGSLN